MKKARKVLLCFSLAMFGSSSATTIKPQSKGLSNDEHYNLNLHGKRELYLCPESQSDPDYDGETHQ